MRLIYTLLFHLILPLVLLRLYWRGVKAPEYRKRWLERLAIFNRDYPKQVVWFHAVSVGEAEAVFPLIRMMLQRHPQAKILVTTTTPTGSARVKSVLAETVEHVYLPYDLPWVIDRFLNTFEPKIAIIMEKEIWPNLFAQCGARCIPLFIINARLSASSARNYKKIPPLVIPALNHVTAIVTQTLEDQKRFIEIGASVDKTTTMGNIKFDVSIAEEDIAAGQLLKRQLFPGRFVWIVASTHKGEDEIFLDIYRQIKTEIPHLLMLLVPRHPERFPVVRRLAEDRKLAVVMRSGEEYCPTQTDISVADTMGELKMLYAAADIALVGGSMVPVGGHNILEPLAVGLPVLFGPHMINFKEIAENVLLRQAAIQCKDDNEITKTVRSLHDDIEFRQSLSANGKEFIKSNQGATESIYIKLENYL